MFEPSAADGQGEGSDDEDEVPQERELDMIRELFEHQQALKARMRVLEDRLGRVERGAAAAAPHAAAVAVGKRVRFLWMGDILAGTVRTEHKTRDGKSLWTIDVAFGDTPITYSNIEDDLVSADGDPTKAPACHGQEAGATGAQAHDWEHWSRTPTRYGPDPPDEKKCKRCGKNGGAWLQSRHRR